jgi:hypothetical protein
MKGVNIVSVPAKIDIGKDGKWVVIELPEEDDTNAKAIEIINYHEDKQYWDFEEDIRSKIIHPGLYKGVFYCKFKEYYIYESDCELEFKIYEILDSTGDTI